MLRITVSTPLLKEPVVVEYITSYNVVQGDYIVITNINTTIVIDLRVIGYSIIVEEINVLS